MIIIEKNINTLYWISYNLEKTIIHYGVTQPNQQTETKLEFNQVFIGSNTWENVLLNEFNITL